MSPLDTEALLARLTVEGELLVRAAAAGDPDARVGGLDWTVRDVVVHTGAVHRWATDIVRRALPRNETGGSLAFHPELDEWADVLDWLRTGLAELTTALDDAADDRRAGRWFCAESRIRDL